MVRAIFRGAWSLLLLKTLTQRGKLHGYAIVLYIQKASDELLQVPEWALTETSDKAKYYRLAIAGRKQLEEAQQGFEQLVKGVRAMLRYA